MVWRLLDCTGKYFAYLMLLSQSVKAFQLCRQIFRVSHDIAFNQSVTFSSSLQVQLEFYRRLCFTFFWCHEMTPTFTFAHAAMIWMSVVWAINRCVAPSRRFVYEVRGWFRIASKCQSICHNYVDKFFLDVDITCAPTNISSRRCHKCS